ncbi:MAG: tRNA dihydrouridine(20/20a) synthase DusA [Chromatiales bacterium]|nr:tRNA dihydrouridine(20/20a) synthase DusA [Chromatiales bacterium]
MVRSPHDVSPADARPVPRLPPIDRRLSVAPMMDCTDRHFRYLVRLVTRHTLLYTEMVTSAALVHGGRDRLLDFAEEEHPIALQLGGSDPAELGRCARFAAGRGFDEINLNVGCPSDRVRSGRFGACLMAEPDVVARCVEAMIAASRLPVTVKTRIGIDDRDRYEDLIEFVGAVAAAGCRTVIIHARKAWLSGLSPKENREIPPLRYDVVYRLKEDFPALEVIVNGGIVSLDEAMAHNERVDGAMMGREAYRNPFVLAQADRRVFGAAAPPPDRIEVAHSMLAYARRELARGNRLHHVTRHMLGLFHATNGARRWRRHLSTEATRRDDAAIIREALQWVGG